MFFIEGFFVEYQEIIVAVLSILFMLGVFKITILNPKWRGDKPHVSPKDVVEDMRKSRVKMRNER